MAEPTRYERGFSFTGFQSTQPNKPLPGTSVDAELDNISASVGSAVSAINDIRREDGALRNGIVGPEALAPGLSTGVTPAVEWAPTVSFTANDTTYFDGAFYRCLQSHVSTDFPTDLALGRWLRYANIGGIVDDVFLARDQAEAAKVLAVAAEAAATPAAATAVAAAGTATDRYELFDDRYLGEKTTLPAVDNDGNPLVDGTLVSLTAQVNPLNDGMYVRRSGAWQFALAPFLGAFTSFRFVATASQTTFTGTDAAGATLAYSPGAVIVTLNGATLAPPAYTATSGNSIVLGTAATAGDTLVIFSLGTFSVADVWSRLESDLRYFNASNLSSGTVANARLPSRLQSTGNFDTTGTGSFGGVVSGGNATADSHFVNRITGDGRFAPIAHVGAGGVAHANATTSVSGFMSGGDKTKMDAFVVPTTMPVQATTSGTQFDFTGIPAGVTEIVINFTNVSMSAVDDMLVQIGDGAIDTAGYDSHSTVASLANATATNGFVINVNNAAARLRGQMRLVRSDPATNRWNSAHFFSHLAAANGVLGGGTKTLTGVLDRVRLTRVGGSATFDLGDVSVFYR